MNRTSGAHLHPDVEERLLDAGRLHAPVDLLGRQGVDSEPPQPLAAVRLVHAQLPVVPVQLGEGGAQEVQELGLLESSRTLQLLDGRPLQHWTRGRRVNASGLKEDRGPLLSSPEPGDSSGRGSSSTQILRTW